MPKIVQNEKEYFSSKRVNITNINGDGVGTGTASSISYNNTNSGLTATNAQAAIDEVSNEITSVKNSAFILGAIDDSKKFISPIDINTILDCGQYSIPSTDIARQCTNLPTNVAGTLIVTDYTGSGLEFDNNTTNHVYRVQRYIAYDNSGIYSRFLYADDINTDIVFGEWDSLVYKSDLDKIDDRTPVADLIAEADKGSNSIRVVTTSATTLNTPYTEGLTDAYSAGTAYINMTSTDYGQIIYYVSGDNSIFTKCKSNNIWKDWVKITTGSDLDKYKFSNLNITLTNNSQISENDDLNNYINPGTYICTTYDIAATLANCPVSKYAFILEVTSVRTDYYMQKIICSNNSEHSDYVRTRNSAGDWGNWKELAYNETVKEVAKAYSTLAEKAVVVIEDEYTSLEEFVSATAEQSDTGNAKGKFVNFTDTTGWGPLGTANIEYKGFIIYQNYYDDDITESVDGSLMLYANENITYNGYISGNKNNGVSVTWKKIVTETDLDELKKSVSDGKTLVADAITAKGVETATDTTFAIMAENIGNINSNLNKTITTLSNPTSYTMQKDGFVCAGVTSGYSQGTQNMAFNVKIDGVTKASSSGLGSHGVEMYTKPVAASKGQVITVVSTSQYGYVTNLLVVIE